MLSSVLRYLWRGGIAMFITDARRVAGHDTFMPSRKPIYPHVFLKEWRLAKRLSGPALADKLGRDKFYISRIETGKQAVDKEERDLLGNALGVPGDSLLVRPNEILGNVTENGLPREGGQKEVETVNLKPLARRLIRKFGDRFIDAVLEEAAREEPSPRPHPRRRA